MALADIAAKLAQTLVTIKLAAIGQDVLTPWLFGLTGVQYTAIQSGIAIGTAALQTAAVLAAPIPQFKDGGIMEQTGLAMINDGGSQEYVERDGRILTTDTKNAIVGLQKGDTVHKDYDSMKKNTMLINSISNGAMLNPNDFDKLLKGVGSSIEKGFNKAKINNYINQPNIDLGEEIWRLKQSR